MKKTTYLLLILLLLASCVEEFKIQQTVSDKYKPVVVQGRILADEESVIYVSYTTPFGQEEMTPVMREWVQKRNGRVRTIEYLLHHQYQRITYRYSICHRNQA